MVIIIEVNKKNRVSKPRLVRDATFSEVKAMYPYNKILHFANKFSDYMVVYTDDKRQLLHIKDLKNDDLSELLRYKRGYIVDRPKEVKHENLANICYIANIYSRGKERYFSIRRA